MKDHVRPFHSDMARRDRWAGGEAADGHHTALGIHRYTWSPLTNPLLQIGLVRLRQGSRYEQCTHAVSGTDPQALFCLKRCSRSPDADSLRNLEELKYQRGPGDAGVLIAESAIALGAQRFSTGALPPVYSAWGYADLGSGEIVRLPDEERVAFDRVLCEAFCQRQGFRFHRESGMLFDALPIGPSHIREYHLLPSSVRTSVVYNNGRLQAMVMLVREPVVSVGRTKE